MNRNADALSRLASPENSTEVECRFEDVLNVVSSLKEFNFNDNQLIFCQRNDPAVQERILECQNGSDTQGYFLDNEILYKRERNGKKLFVITYDLVEDLLKFYHNTDLIIHLSQKRLYNVLRNRFYWYGIFLGIPLIGWQPVLNVLSKKLDNQ